MPPPPPKKMVQGAAARSPIGGRSREATRESSVMPTFVRSSFKAVNHGPGHRHQARSPPPDTETQVPESSTQLDTWSSTISPDDNKLLNRLDFPRYGRSGKAPQIYIDAKRQCLVDYTNHLASGNSASSFDSSVYWSPSHLADYLEKRPVRKTKSKATEPDQSTQTTKLGRTVLPNSEVQSNSRAVLDAQKLDAERKLRAVIEKRANLSLNLIGARPDEVPRHVADQEPF